MNIDTLETIRKNIRTQSEAIYNIKNEHIALNTAISPKSEKWKEYLGRKKQVTIFLIMLHLFKGTTQFIESHTKNKFFILEAKNQLIKLTEDESFWKDNPRLTEVIQNA